MTFSGNIHHIPSEYELLTRYPKPQAINLPEHLPDAVASTFTEAIMNHRDKRFESACMMFRKTLELSLSEFIEEKTVFGTK